MRKALCAILTPILAALLAVPLVSIGPGASSNAMTVGVTDSSGVPAARPADPLVRSLAGLRTRSPHDGQGAAPATALAPSNASLSLELLSLHLDSSRYPAPVTGTARQLPAFPTGPPSHS
jgi:hypothetical protein